MSLLYACALTGSTSVFGIQVFSVPCLRLTIHSRTDPNWSNPNPIDPNRIEPGWLTCTLFTAFGGPFTSKLIQIGWLFTSELIWAKLIWTEVIRVQLIWTEPGWLTCALFTAFGWPNRTDPNRVDRLNCSFIAREAPEPTRRRWRPAPRRAWAPPRQNPGSPSPGPGHIRLQKGRWVFESLYRAQWISKVPCALFWNLHSLPFLPIAPLECKFQNKTCTEPFTH